MSDPTNRLADSVPRRTVLKAVTAGATLTTVPVGSVLGDDHLINVSPLSIELKPEEKKDVEVEIQGPPFGRTDVEVSGVPAEPSNFRLSDRGASQIVTLGPVSDDETAVFHASLPRDDEQEVEVEIEYIFDPLIDGTAADTEIPVRVFGESSSEEQFNALEGISLADPFTLAVEAPDLADEESFEYAVTTYFDEVGESPSNRASGPGVPLDFDDQGIASVTIGSPGVEADVNAWWDATTINNIEVPAGSTRMAVETQ